jgi:4-hydroxybenzoate polyprenyltransferase
MLYSTTAIIISFNDRLLLISLLAAILSMLFSALVLRKSNPKKKRIRFTLIFFCGFSLSLLILWQATQFQPLRVEMIHVH